MSALSTSRENRGRSLALAVLISAALLAAVEARAQPLPNFRADGVETPAAALAPGDLLDVEAVVEVERPSAGAVGWRVLLSPDGRIEGAVPLAPPAPADLSMAGTSRLQSSLPIPAGTAGLFFVAVEIDPSDAVPESNEFDNLVVSAQRFRVRPRQPNFRVGSVVPGSTGVDAGATLPVAVDVSNTGDASATVDVAIVLSVDETVSTADLEVARTTVTLAPSALRPVAVDAAIPAVTPAGGYTVGALLDPDRVVDERVENDNDAASAERVTVRRAEIALEPPTLPDATLGIDYYARVFASGGDGLYRYEVSEGALPDGLSLSLTGGVVSGVPAATGTFEFGVRARSDGRTTDRSYRVSVSATGAPLQIAWDEAGAAYRGLPYNQRLVAGGGEPPYQWTLTTGPASLPPGLTLRPTGTIAGVAEVFGTFTFGVQVEDRLGATDEASVTVEVTNPSDLVIGQAPLPPVRLGAPADLTLTVVGGVAPYSWSALTPPPPGLTLETDGRFTGTPSQVGEWPVRVRVTDGKREPSADDAVVRVIVEPGGEFEIVTTELPPGQVRALYEVFIEAEGGAPPYAWRIVPGTSLPSGFFLADADTPDAPPNSARLYGRASAPLVQAFAVRVEDSVGRRREVALVLDVNRDGSTAGGGSGCVCQRPGPPSFAALWLCFAFFAWRRRS